MFEVTGVVCFGVVFAVGAVVCTAIIIEGVRSLIGKSIA